MKIVDDAGSTILVPQNGTVPCGKRPQNAYNECARPTVGASAFCGIFVTFLVVVVAHSCPFLSIFCHRRVSGCVAMRVRLAAHRMMGAGIVPIHT